MLEPKPIKSTYEYDGLKIELTCLDHNLDEILSAMQSVIRGAGFSFSGELVIDDFDSETKTNESQDF